MKSLQGMITRLQRAVIPAETRLLAAERNTNLNDPDKIMAVWNADKKKREQIVLNAISAQGAVDGKSTSLEVERARYLAAVAMGVSSNWDDPSERSPEIIRCREALFRIFSKTRYLPGSVLGSVEAPETVRYIKDANQNPSHTFRNLTLLDGGGYLTNFYLRDSYWHNNLVDYLFSLGPVMVEDYDLARRALGLVSEFIRKSFPGHFSRSEKSCGANFLKECENCTNVAIVAIGSVYGVSQNFYHGDQCLVPLEEEVQRIIDGLQRAKPMVQEIFQPENRELFRINT